MRGWRTGEQKREGESVLDSRGRCWAGTSRLVGAVSWLAVLCAVMLSAGPASGATGHTFVSTLSEAPMGTKLSKPGAVAVDHASGDVFVADPGTGMVDVFSASGVFVSQFGAGKLDVVGIGVGEASGLVYVADSHEDAVLVFKPNGDGEYGLLSEWFGEGVPGGEFGRVRGVAVDNSSSFAAGDVYVLDGKAPGLEEGVVDVLKPKPAGPEEGGEGVFVRRLTAGKLEAPNGVAVSGSSGRVVVADSVKGTVYIYSAEGVLEEKVNGKGSPYGVFEKEAPVGDVASVAVDDATGDVYVAEAERHAVSEYATGEWVGWITSTPAGDLDEARGVALSSSGEVFVDDAGAGVVDRFTAGVVVPSVETGKVAKSALTRTTAVMPGMINGEGSAAQYLFQYGETDALGSETPAFGSGPGQQAVSVAVEGLHAGTIYYYRIVGEDEGGTSSGSIRELETPPAVEGLQTGPVEDLAPESATLTGSLKRGGLETHYEFQYGTSVAYGADSPEPPEEVPAGKEEKEEKQLKALATAVAGLQPNTLYHYRLVAQNSYGKTYGADETFTTSGPPRITNEPLTGIGQEEATLHAQIDPDQFATSYSVQYGETSGYGSEVSGGAVGSGKSPVAVAMTLATLKVGATYHYRIVAVNEAGTTYGADQTFTTVPSAPVDATYATGVSSSEATLHAEINPLGHDTHYYFQHGTQSCQTNPGACTDTPLPPGEDIGEGKEDVAGEVKLSGLKPGVTYHYRVVDSNSLGMTEGSEQTFTTGSVATSFALPDDRAWEMVSPPNKHGAPVEALTREGGLILASEDGSALTYVVDGALGEEAQGNRSPEMQQILATREPQGWASQNIVTPNSRAYGVAPGNPTEYQFFSPDLSLALVEPFGPEPPLSSDATQKTIYLRDDQSGAYLPLVTEANTASGTKFGGQIHFVSATPDLAHVLIQSKVGLIEAAGRGLYEWEAGRLRFVSVLPAGTPAPSSSLGFGDHVIANAISNDGSRVIWEDKAEGTTRGHLYMRDTAAGETIQLDAAQGVAEPEQGSAQFQGASADGSRVFFTDRQRLTPDSTAEPGSLTGADLYECDVIEVAGKLTCKLKDLTSDHNEGEYASVQGLPLGISEDGASVYVVAHGVLAVNANGNGERAQAGAENLYEVYESAGEWSRTFIATLASQDSPEWEGGATKSDTAFVTARVSPNGRYLAFMSAAPITGYDNIDANPAAKGARAEEVYLYDANSVSLRCISCNPTGARPEGVLDAVESGEGLGLLVDRRKVWAEEGHEHWLAGNIPGWTAQSLVGALFQSRYLSDEGRLFFNSADALVPQVTVRTREEQVEGNAQPVGVENVYEYEPQGVGSCQSTSGGCVSLISSGSSSKESAFLEATPSGNDVFFLTGSQLLPQDTDTAFDVYDARVCTEVSPCLTPPEPPPPGCSQTKACRPAQPAQPIPGVAPPSASASGPGSPVQTPPAKHAIEAKKVSKAPTRAQELKRALNSCRRQHAHSRHRRQACEAYARKRFGPKHRAKAKRGKGSKAGKSHRSTRGRGR
jgi:DNA-binding beta-propeller fold protein YncE